MTAKPVPRAVERYIEIVNAEEYAKIGDLFAEDAVFEAPTGETIVGREAIRAFYSSGLQRMNPSKVWIHSSVTEGNNCVIEIAARLPGEPPDGPFHVVVDYFTVNDAGEVTRMAVYLPMKEVNGARRQLGLD